MRVLPDTPCLVACNPLLFSLFEQEACQATRVSALPPHCHTTAQQNAFFNSKRCSFPQIQGILDVGTYRTKVKSYPFPEDKASWMHTCTVLGLGQANVQVRSVECGTEHRARHRQGQETSTHIHLTGCTPHFSSLRRSCSSTIY